MRQRIWDHGGTRRSGTNGIARGPRGDRGTPAASMESLEGRTFFAITGPDGFGYEANAHPYEAIDLELPAAGEPTNGVVSVMGNDDDLAHQVSLGNNPSTGLPNTFNFYGTSYTSLFVTTNGLVTFGPEYDVAFESSFNDNLTTGITAPTISALWTDWITYRNDADAVYYKLDDANGRLIVEWNRVRHSSNVTNTAASPVTFQAILQLNTGDSPGAITFNYGDITTDDQFTNGGRATVGIKGAGAQTTEPGANRLLISPKDGTSQLQGDGSAIRISTNRAPVAAGDAYATDEDTALVVAAPGLVRNDTDADGDALTVQLVSGPERGLLTLNADGTFEYLPPRTSAAT